MITELGLDCGDVCMSYPIDIPDDMTCEDLYKIIADKSPALISDTLKGLYNGTLKPVKQCEEGACIASKLKSDEFKIDWTKTACEIHNLIRGVYKSPGAYFCFNGKNIKVMNSCVISQQSNCKPGTIICVGKDGIDFATGNGVLRITRVKPESKGEMAARDWYNGVKNTIGVLVK